MAFFSALVDLLHPYPRLVNREQVAHELREVDAAVSLEEERQLVAVELRERGE